MTLLFNSGKGTEFVVSENGVVHTKRHITP